MAIIGSDIATTTEKPIQTGGESSLSSWAGDYVTSMLGKGQALSNEGYNAYMGPLTAGSSDFQNAAFEGWVTFLSYRPDGRRGLRTTGLYRR
jgi:hypothetical protein